jgi:hypothetical protein
MELASLVGRKGDLEASLRNIEQSFHIITGHLAEVNYQITELAKADSQKSEDETLVECPVEAVLD